MKTTPQSIDSLSGLYHRSSKPLAIGTVLAGRGLPQWVEEIEDEFETRMPIACISRRKAVFMTAEIGNKDGVHGEYIYRVKPLGRVERHDNVWYRHVQKAYILRERGIVPKRQVWNETILSRACDAYWTGESSSQPNWEYLTDAAVVEEEVAQPTA